MSKERRQSLKLLELGSFDTCKNAVALMIAMLGHLKLDIKVSDTDIETAEFDNCRGMSRNDRNTNGMLAMMQGEVIFFYKDKQKFINHLPSQSVDYVRQASYIQEPKSRKNQVE